MQVLKVTVKPQKDRLDQFVADLVKNLSRSAAKKLIKEGYILVDGQVSDPAYKVRKGDTIKVEIPAAKEVSLKPEKIPLTIIYEDQELLVVDKPPNLVTHPTLDHPSGTLVNAILNYLKDLKSDDLRPGVVHRLDKNTSGVVVVAKTQTALENLKKQFRDREVSKTYISLVTGRVEKEVGVIKEKIDRHPKFRSKFTASEGGREATTEYKVLERFDKFTVLELKPLTGRTHQIRVHLSHIGHPVVGDKLYGGKMLLGRQFLHAAKLELTHPTSGKRMRFESALPSDLENFLKKLKS